MSTIRITTLIILSGLSVVFLITFGRVVAENAKSGQGIALEGRGKGFTYFLSSFFSWLLIASFLGYFFVIRSAVLVDAVLPSNISSKINELIERYAAAIDQDSKDVVRRNGMELIGRGVDGSSNLFFLRPGSEKVPAGPEFPARGDKFELQYQECVYEGTVLFITQAVATAAARLISGTGCPMAKKYSLERKADSFLLGWHQGDGSVYEIRFAF